MTIEKSWAGPRTDQISLRLGRGERIRRLRAVLENIALCLGTPTARLTRGAEQGTVVLEIARPDADQIFLADVLFEDDDNMIPVPLEASLPWIVGVSIQGSPVIRDRAQSPHVLISGMTGSGKSVVLQSLVLGLMLTTAPEDVEVILIDAEGTELADPYLRHRDASAPHRVNYPRDRVNSIPVSGVPQPLAKLGSGPTFK